MPLILISLLFKSRSTHQRPVSALTIMAKVVLARDYKTVGVFLLKLGFQGAQRLADIFGGSKKDKRISPSLALRFTLTPYQIFSFTARVRAFLTYAKIGAAWQSSFQLNKSEASQLNNILFLKKYRKYNTFLRYYIYI